MASKASTASTAKDNLIVGVVSHEQNLHDSHTLPEILRHTLRLHEAKWLNKRCDRGYRGKREVNGTQIILPGKALKRDTVIKETENANNAEGVQRLQPIIGHLKSDYRLSRNYLKGALGDHINLLMAAAAWNMKQWLIAIFWLFFPWRKMQIT